MLQVFRNRKMAAVLLLGFSSGLPLFLTSRTLQAWMTVEGVDLTTIGLFSLLSLPYSFKFLWSPLVDRFRMPFSGRRKGWLLATQLGLAAAIAAMSVQRPAAALRFLALNALVIALLSATQDITVDAYTTDILNTHEMGAGSGIKIFGYRAAMIVTGAGALVLADYVSWPVVYVLLGVLMLGTTLLSARVPEPALGQHPPSSMREAVRLPFAEFFQRVGSARGAAILAFVVVYRLGDGMIGNMTTSFLIQTGFRQTDIGVIQGGVGLAATIAGVVAGGALTSRLGIHRSLWIFGVLQAASNLAYWMLAIAGRNYPLMVATMIIENFCYGLVTAALVGFLMSLCNPRFSATQYALLSSMMTAGRDGLASISGSVAQMSGWPAFFLITILAGIPGMLLLPLFAPWNGAATREICSTEASIFPNR